MSTTNDERQPARPIEDASHASPGPVPDRKPGHLSWESFADRRIREAEEAGAFQQLPGLGKPIPDIDAPLGENWWVKKKLRDENLSVVPPTIAVRKEIERLRAELPGISGEQTVRRRLAAMNEQILKAIYSTTIGPADGVQLLDIEAEVAAWHQARRGQ